MKPTVRILVGDALASLQALPSGSVHCCVTSPPYYGLRDYGVEGQIGLEETPDVYVSRLAEVFREVRRGLRDDGTLWLNIGDSYASGGRATYRSGASDNKGQRAQDNQARPVDPDYIKPKDLLGIPWMLAFALRADGWYLRQDIIWHKPNPMPESVRDRCTKAHEYLFVLSKSERYFWDSFAMQEDGVFPEGTKAAKGSAARQKIDGVNARPPEYKIYTGKRNRRSVWTIPTRPFKGAHFATFPPTLIEPCVEAGASEKGVCAECGTPWVRKTGQASEPPHMEDSKLDRFGTGKAGVHRAFGSVYQKWLDENPLETLAWAPGCRCDAGKPVPATVLDPFAGSGTTGSVAKRLGRSAILCELNADYVALACNRIALEVDPPGSPTHEVARFSLAVTKLRKALKI